MMMPKTNKAELEAREFPVKFDVFNPSLIIPSKTIGIYRITSPSGKIYIGQSRDIQKRMEVYRRMKSKSQTKIHNSFLKHGLDKHVFEVVCLCEIAELNDLECHYMQLYDSFNSESGLNLKIGGNVKVKISDDTRQKLRDSHKGQVAWNKGKKSSPETIEKMKLINKGKVWTEEQKQKVRVPKKKPRTEEHKTNNGLANKGKKRTEEQRRARLERNKLNPNPKKGIPRSPETIKKIKDFYEAKRQTPEYIEKQKEKAKKKEEVRLEKEIKSKKKEADKLEIKTKKEREKKGKIIQKIINNLLQVKNNTNDFLRDYNGKYIRIKKIKLVSKETGMKISLSKKGYKHSEEAKRKMSESTKGQIRTPETTAKIKETKRLILEERRMMIF